MKRNLLAVIKANTSPISEKDFETFLVSRHGVVTRENASADTSALDTIGKDSLNSKNLKTRKYAAFKGPAAQRYSAYFKAAKSVKGINRTTVKQESLQPKKKLTF